jgi:hypothetical protein
VAYWWRGDPDQKYWVEIRREPGIGESLWCGTVDEEGHTNPWYELVSSVKQGEVIYHWHAGEHRFVGRSIAAADAVTLDVDEAAAANDEPDRAIGAYTVELRDFTPIVADVSLTDVRAVASQLYHLRDELLEQYGPPLYLPFQFRDQPRFMSNYFAKLPAQLIPLLFGRDELGESQVPQISESSGDSPAEPTDQRIDPGPNPRAFLAPFHPRADTEYVVGIQGGRRTQSRKHEKLVNSCAEWLAELGFHPGCNAAVDLGVDEPPIVIEAKIIGVSWAAAIRAAVGQLYEYRYFKVSDPNSRLIFLANKPVPSPWVEYLESDRDIGVMWPDAGGFEMSTMATRTLGRSGSTW